MFTLWRCTYKTLPVNPSKGMRPQTIPHTKANICRTQWTTTSRSSCHIHLTFMSHGSDRKSNHFPFQTAHWSSLPETNVLHIEQVLLLSLSMRPRGIRAAHKKVINQKQWFQVHTNSTSSSRRVSKYAAAVKSMRHGPRFPLKITEMSCRCGLLQ